MADTADEYVNPIAEEQGPSAYSFVFSGQFGYLDHALASSSLLPQVPGVTEWHINADEPDILDYDTSFKPPAQDALYEPNAFRSSDHDPVIVGLALRATVDDIIHYFDAAVAAGTISDAENEKTQKSGKSGKSAKDSGNTQVEKVRHHLVKAEQKELKGKQKGACKNIGKAQKHLMDGKLEGDDAIVVEIMIATYQEANCPE